MIWAESALNSSENPHETAVWQPSLADRYLVMRLNMAITVVGRRTFLIEDFSLSFPHAWQRGTADNVLVAAGHWDHTAFATTVPEMGIERQANRHYSFLNRHFWTVS
jgi:hypothetical protein